jgi:hypothetical protein
MRQQRRISRQEQLLVEDVERLTRLLDTGSTPEARETAAQLLAHARTDLEKYRMAFSGGEP